MTEIVGHVSWRSTPAAATLYPQRVYERMDLTMSTVLNRHFARHYLEMVAVMFLGMAVLWLPAGWGLESVGSSWADLQDEAPAAMLLLMAATMTVPMAAWMRRRGHGLNGGVELVTPGQAGEVALSNGLALRAGPLPDTPPRHDTLVVAGGVGTGEAVGDAQRTDVDPISRLVSANLHPAAHCTVELGAGCFSHVQP